MALSEEVKQQIRDFHDAGKSPEEIEALTGVPRHHFTFVIKQHRVRLGLEDPPAKGTRRVREQKTVTYVEPDPAEAPGHSPSGTAAAGSGSPLCPAGSNPAEVVRVEVNRVTARPRHMGTGMMGNVDGQADASVIDEMWGGGRYLCKGFNNRGGVLWSVPVEIAGDSKPKEDPAAMMPYPYPGTGSDQTVIAEVLKSALSQKPGGEMVEVLKAILSQKPNGDMNAMIQLMIAQNAQTTQLLIAAMQNNKPIGPTTSLKDTVETFIMLKEAMGDKDGDSSGMMELAKAGLPVLAEAMKAKAAAGNGSAVQRPKKPPTVQSPASGELKDAAKIMYDHYVAAGVPEDIAYKRVLEIAGIVKNDLANVPTAEEEPETPAAPTPNGEGEKKE